MVFISLYVMQIVNCSVLCFSESICPFSGFPNGKTCSSFAIPTATRTRTDLFLPSFAVILKTFLTSSILVSKSSYVSPLGPGSGDQD